MTAVKPLWEETRDLHHACEAHDVGGAMATGKPPRVWYAAWLRALFQIHNVIDLHVPKEILRSYQILEDMSCMEVMVGELRAAQDYVKTLDNDKAIDGAVYVLTGAHLMGGEIMRRRLEDFPTKHLEWEDRKASIAVLQTYRTRDDITEEARACFQALLNIMDEIKAKYPNGV
jgi:hypothetical protein